uniref:Uncharacterized protein n=1 Tax=Romanomermis culicivorax TaxID=13658 RepID=A0A915HLH2_ROMCU
MHTFVGNGMQAMRNKEILFSYHFERPERQQLRKLTICFNFALAAAFFASNSCDLRVKDFCNSLTCSSVSRILFKPTFKCNCCSSNSSLVNVDESIDHGVAVLRRTRYAFASVREIVGRSKLNAFDVHGVDDGFIVKTTCRFRITCCVNHLYNSSTESNIRPSRCEPSFICVIKVVNSSPSNKPGTSPLANKNPVELAYSTTRSSQNVAQIFVEISRGIFAMNFDLKYRKPVEPSNEARQSSFATSADADKQ